MNLQNCFIRFTFVSRISDTDKINVCQDEKKKGVPSEVL